MKRAPVIGCYRQLISTTRERVYPQNCLYSLSLIIKLFATPDGSRSSTSVHQYDTCIINKQTEFPMSILDGSYLCIKRTLFILLALAISVNGQYSRMKKRVCVIGAGPAGLVAARILTSHPQDFEFTVFEKNSDVGGLWIYTDSTTVDEHGLPVHSSMYRDLRTNVPREVVRYLDFTEIKGENRSFVKHETILEYLKSYTDYFGLRRYILFNANVEKVSPLPEEKWLVQVRDLDTQNLKEITCDAIIIANGHFVKGNIPTIPGIEDFPGQVLHSHLYRKPEIFTGQTIVVLGASRSGIDISIEISRFARKVYLSSRHDKLNSEFPPNVEQVAGVVSAYGSHLILSDNTRVRADTLILCTGYFFDFPFLDSSSGISIVQGKYIRSLYKHLINIEHPTMAILTVPGFHFGMSQAQTPYFLSVLRGNITLPSREEMLKDSQIPPGKSLSKVHELSAKELFVYFAELASAGGGQLLPPSIEAGYYAYISHVRGDPLHYREKNLYFFDDGHVEFV